MANFWDLPKPIREKIYRLHLVSNDHISGDQHRTNVKHESPFMYRRRQRKHMPPLLYISKTAEEEAAPIYYGENHFEFSPVSSIWLLGEITYPRHMRLITTVTCSWSGYCPREGFLVLGKMKGLQELYIRVNEKGMIQHTLGPRYHKQWWIANEPTPQQQLAVLRHSGITGLLSLSNIPHVEFIKLLNAKKEEYGGPIPGGVLETQVIPKLRGMVQRFTHIGLDDDTFPFLSLPPEVRNRVYDLLLCIPGPLHPSALRPSSAPKKVQNRHYTRPTPQSALNLLAVNKQINDEALGIFYHRNAFEFYYPTQFHAFVLSLSSPRLCSLRDITIYYHNSKSGGIDIAGLTFPLLKQLTGLRRLHVLLRHELEQLIFRPRWSSSLNWKIEEANPVLLPGLRVLFSLRGITDIVVRDLELEKEFEKLKKDVEYPRFAEMSKKACVVQITRALEHFNTAIAGAQKGMVNQKLLDDPKWHMKSVFPVMEDDEVENV